MFLGVIHKQLDAQWLEALIIGTNFHGSQGDESLRFQCPLKSNVDPIRISIMHWIMVIQFGLDKEISNKL